MVGEHTSPLIDLVRFIALVEAGTMTQAGRDRGEDQSTISRSVVRLEATLGQLFTRNPRGDGTPTAAGWALYGGTKRHLIALDAALEPQRRSPRK
jgi:DNA-binding transcriptional LysR family regulator